MRIVFITSSSSKSGGSRQAMYLARGLVERGHDLTFHVPHDAELPELDPGLPWARLPKARGDWRGAVAASLHRTPAVVQSFHNRACKRLSWWSLAWRWKGVVSCLTRGVCYRPGNPLPYSSPGVDAIVVNSEACGRVLRSFPVFANPKKIHVIRNGVPGKRLAAIRERDRVRGELNALPGELVVGCVAGNKPVKGVDVLVRAASAWKFPFRLAVIGAAPGNFMPLAEEVGIGSRATFIPFAENVADYLDAFDLFALPSRSESMPNVLLEAIMAGLPVVGTAVGGVPEVVEGNGLVVPPDNPEALSQAVSRLAAEPELRSVFAAKSLDLAAKYTIAAKVDRSEALYQSLLKARRLAP